MLLTNLRKLDAADYNHKTGSLTGTISLNPFSMRRSKTSGL